MHTCEITDSSVDGEHLKIFKKQLKQVIKREKLNALLVNQFPIGKIIVPWQQSILQEGSEHYHSCKRSQLSTLLSCLMKQSVILL